MTDFRTENTLALQEPLYQLRSETKDAFDEAKQFEARWKEVEREQREVYQVCKTNGISWHTSFELSTFRDLLRNSFS